MRFSADASPSSLTLNSHFQQSSSFCQSFHVLVSWLIPSPLLLTIFNATFCVLAQHTGTFYLLQPISCNIFSSYWLSVRQREMNWCFLLHVKEIDTVVFLKPWKAASNHDPSHSDNTSHSSIFIFFSCLWRFHQHLHHFSCELGHEVQS